MSDEVEAAYRRGDLSDKRRHLVADWSRYGGYFIGRPMAQAAYLDWERHLDSNAMTIAIRG